MIQPRVAHQIHDQHLPRGERVDAIGNAHRDALHEALLRLRSRGEVGRAGKVDHVERDDARVGRAGADARDQILEIGAPLTDLRVDVAVRIAAAASRAAPRGAMMLASLPPAKIVTCVVLVGTNGACALDEVAGESTRSAGRRRARDLRSPGSGPRPGC